MRQHRARGPREGCLKRKRHLLKQIFLNVMKDRFLQSPPFSSNAENSQSFPPAWKGLSCRSVLSDANKREQGLAEGDVKELHGRRPVRKKTPWRASQRWSGDESREEGNLDSSHVPRHFSSGGEECLWVYKLLVAASRVDFTRATFYIWRVHV